MRRNIKQRHSNERFAHHVRLLLLPHAHNDYRPHMVRWYGVTAILLVVVALQFGYNFAESGSVLGRSSDVSRAELLQGTNSERQARGEPTLRLSTTLNQAAELKAQDMVDNQYWSHTSPNGIPPWTWFKQAGYSYDSAGENLARGFTTSNGVMKAWMASKEHEANVLNVNYSEVGFAVKQASLNGEPTTLVVALYGSPKGTSATARQAVLAAEDQSISLVSKIGIGIQSMTPALLGSIALLLFGATLALLAHFERKRLPYEWRKNLMKHHGMLKAGGMLSLVVLMLALYGGGQI